ncbi:MAG: protein-L-isoaspartate(D-aspartate) O-methyltransferase [Deltaproteobacteria bacterium]|nr:protein-L-isoaspartate(D-aspartate) O-methyltransferase [Deltaproteobacteria bacterium]
MLPAFSCAQENKDFARLREQMVERQIKARGVTDPDVLSAMERVPRHRFVPEKYRSLAYGDHPLPIGEGQTISQPYIVAYMTQALDLKPHDRVLEIGTGSGYQAAVLAELAEAVYTIEIVETLGKRAKKTLDASGYENVHVRIGDGYKGWPEQAPFDAVMVTCAPEAIPDALVSQLKDGGRMIIPVGPVGTVQRLVRCVKKDGRLVRENVMPVRFVPMVGERDR